MCIRDRLRPVAAVSTGVLGNTGFESAELLAGLIVELNPAAVIAIDALAARDLSRLGCTVQLSNTGIHPGAGVQNARKGLSQETLGIPVIGIGVPTVVDAATLALDLMQDPSEGWEEKISPRGAKMVVTPREIDLLVSRSARLIACLLYTSSQKESGLSALCFDSPDLLRLISLHKKQGSFQPIPDQPPSGGYVPPESDRRLLWRPHLQTSSAAPFS